MSEAIEQSAIYVWKNEAGMVFFNRNQFRIVTQ